MRLRLSFLMLSSLILIAQDGREAVLGASLAKEIRQCTTSIGNEGVQDYVAQLARRLYPDAATHFTFEVVVDGLGESTNPTNEPLSFPGGYIFISTKLILASQNEAEFAGMLAQAMVRPGAVSAGGREPRFVWIDMHGWCGSPILPVAHRDRQRGSRLAADQVAVSVMARAGYNPRALTGYLTREHAEAERIAALQQAVESASPSGSLLQNDEFVRIQQEVRSLMPNPIRRPPSLRRGSH